VNATLLVCDAGYVAYASHFHIVDMVGLKTPEAIPLNRRYTWPSAGTQRAQAVSALARNTKVGYLVIVQSWSELSVLPQQIQGLGWRVDPLRTEGAYYVYQLTAPGEIAN
jgi:hypothetical protein